MITGVMVLKSVSNRVDVDDMRIIGARTVSKVAYVLGTLMLMAGSLQVMDVLFRAPPSNYVSDVRQAVLVQNDKSVAMEIHDHPEIMEKHESPDAKQFVEAPQKVVVGALEGEAAAIRPALPELKKPEDANPQALDKANVARDAGQEEGMSGQEHNTQVRYSKPPAKVLLLTYMRGGSTFLGALLDQNPNATLWFEPIDGVYSDLYGSVHGWFPLDLLMQTDMTLRELPVFEQMAIRKHVNNLLTCNIQGLTTDILGHFAMTHIIQKRFSDYAACVKKINTGGTRAADGKKISPAWMCKTRIKALNMREFPHNESGIRSNYYCIHAYENGPFYDSKAITGWSGKPMDSYCEDVNSDVFRSYGTCMTDIRGALQACMPEIERVCRQSNVIGMKAIRLCAVTVQTLMEDQPDLKVVYLMRDPRGIVTSRKFTGLLSRLSNKSLEKEASALCKRMKYDLDVLQNIERRFPGRLLRLQYEQLVLQPIENAKLFYQFINRDVPESVEKFLNAEYSEDVKPNAFNTIRKNGTQSIDKWKKLLRREDISAISDVCSEILTKFNYPL